MSGGRTLGIAVASIVGFAVGVYLALYLVLATMDWGQPFEPELLVLTITLSTALATLAGVLVAPRRGEMWKPMAIGASAVGLISLIVLLLVETDPVAMIFVGILETGAIVAGAHTSA